MTLHGLGQVAKKKQDAFDALIGELLDLILQERTAANRDHGLRQMIRDGLHARAAPTRQDHRLGGPTIKPAFYFGLRP
jgi:hypothetical protein